MQWQLARAQLPPCTPAFTSYVVAPAPWMRCYTGLRGAAGGGWVLTPAAPHSHLDAASPRGHGWGCCYGCRGHVGRVHLLRHHNRRRCRLPCHREACGQAAARGNKRRQASPVTSLQVKARGVNMLPGRRRHLVVALLRGDSRHQKCLTTGKGHAGPPFHPPVLCAGPCRPLRVALHTHLAHQTTTLLPLEAEVVAAGPWPPVPGVAP